MSQETEKSLSLSDLALLSIENEHARMINVAKMIDVFAEEKAIKNCNAGAFFQVAYCSSIAYRHVCKWNN